jgi:lysophospholipase L1-like esterase
LLWLAITASAQTPPVRIMPLGDSITNGVLWGTRGAGGYRGPLYTLLTNAGYNVDYVGTLKDNPFSPDPDHEGRSGWHIGRIDSKIADWLANLASPDVVLLHIGTNDFGLSIDTATAINRLDALILKIATLRPYTHIIVTNLLVRAEPLNTQIQNQFNPFVQALVTAHAAVGRRVTFLDMRSVVPLSDLPDGLHPNQTGYDKMANAWLPAIQAVISPLGDSLPPGIARVFSPDPTHVVVTFSKPVEDAAVALANYSVGGLTISSGTLDAVTKREVTLTTCAMMPEAGGLWGTHQFGVDQNNNLYTAEVWGGRPQKFVPRPGADSSVLVGQPVRGVWSN